MNQELTKYDDNIRYLYILIIFLFPTKDGLRDIVVF